MTLAMKLPRKRAVEMTEEENPQKARTGIFLFLGKRQNQERAFHIPTAPATATLISQLIPKGALLTCLLPLPSGSSFD
jgi:hypothetical protein